MPLFGTFILMIWDDYDDEYDDDDDDDGGGGDDDIEDYDAYHNHHISIMCISPRAISSKRY